MFKNRLKEIRTLKGYTQKQVADFLDIVPRSYQGYELGDREPNLDKIEKISNFLDVSIDYLFGKTDNPNSHKL